MDVKITQTATGRYRIADEEVMSRVLLTLAELGRSLRADHLRQRVKGQAARIDVARDRLIKAGLLRKTKHGFMLTAAGKRFLLSDEGDGDE